MQSKIRPMIHQNTKGRDQASLRRGAQSRVKSAAMGGESNSKSHGGSVRQERRPPVPSAPGARRKEAWAQRQKSVTPSPRTPTKVQGQMQKNDTDKTAPQEKLRLEKQQITELQTEMKAKEKKIKQQRDELYDLLQGLQQKDPDNGKLQQQQVKVEVESQLETKKQGTTTGAERSNEKDMDKIALQQQNTKLLEDLKVKDREINTLREQLKEQREEKQRATQMESQLRTTRDEKEKLQQSLREEQQQVNILERQLRTSEAELETTRTEKERLQQNLREKQQQVSGLEGQLRRKEDEITTARAQLRETQQRETEHNNPRDWIINRNEIQLTSQQLGKGAWGLVLRGKFRECDVAVKEMYKNIISDHNRLLFEREVNIASKCRHPCLLQFIGATADDETPLLVTEIMDCSLRAKLDNKGEPPLSAKDVSVISLDVARALNYLHQAPTPIIHRDISSANVLLWRRGDQWRAKVSDYGTANFVCQSARNDTGAAIYSAPESMNENPDQPISCKVSTLTNQLQG